MHECAYMFACRGQKIIPGFPSIILYIPEIGSLSESGARLAASKP